MKNANLKFFELSPKYERDNIKLGLSRIKKALQELGNPCKNIPVVRIVPPLVISRREINILLDKLNLIFEEL